MKLKFNPPTSKLFGGDTNGVSQANPVTTIVPIKAH